MTVNRVRTRLGAAMAAVALGATMLAATTGTAQALSNPAHPALTFDHVITSHPFTGAPGNAIDIEGLGYVPADNSMWVADDNGDRVWEIDPGTGAYKSQLRGGNPATNAANIDFTTATNVSSGKACNDPSLVDPTFLDVTGTMQVDNGNYECLSRTDDFESAVFDPGATPAATDDALYVTSGNCCTAGFPAVYVDGDNNPATPPTLSSYPFHPTVWKLTRDGSGHFKPAQWQALPEGTDPTAAGFRPGVGMYFGHSKTVQTYDFASNSLGSTFTLPVPNGTSDIVGLAFTDTNTAFVTTASPNVASGRVTANSDSTIQRFDIVGPTWVKNTTWTFPLKSIGNAAAGVDQAGMIDARDLAIIGDKFYVSDGYDSRVSGDHPIYVYNLVDQPVVTGGTGWHFTVQNGASSGVTNDKFGNGNSLLQYGTQLHGFYQDTSKSALDHSWWDGTKWNDEILDGNGRNTSNNVGANVASIQYGSQLQLFYTNASTHTLRHAWWDGKAWGYEALDGAGGANGRTSDSVAGSTIVVRQYGGSQLQVFYSDDTAHALRHAWYDGQWHFETLDTNIATSNVGIAATQYGSTFHVVYTGASGLLRHAWYDTKWNKETLDGDSTVGGRTNDNVGNYVKVLQYGTQLDIVYQNSTTSSVRHAWWNGAKWSYETLDGSNGTIPGHTNNAVGAYIAVLPFQGGLHLMYQDGSTGALRHAWFANGWHVEVLDGSGSPYPGHFASSDTGRFTSMLQYGTQLQLTYFDHGNADRWIHTWYG
jgi:hypothetical protein